MPTATSPSKSLSLGHKTDPVLKGILCPRKFSQRLRKGRVSLLLFNETIKECQPRYSGPGAARRYCSRTRPTPIMAPIQSNMRSHNESLTPVASNSVLSKQTTVTPFSIGMFRHLDVHPKAGPARGPELTPVVTIRPESIWNSLIKYRNFTRMSGLFFPYRYPFANQSKLETNIMQSISTLSSHELSNYRKSITR